MTTVTPISPELIPSAAVLLADAFFTNPAHRYLCPDPARRQERLRWLLGGNLRVQPGFETSFCLARGGVVDAMGFWTRSGEAGPALRAQVRAGLLLASVRLGLRGVRRLVEVSTGIDRQRDRAVGDRPFWYLNNMVVRESLRGTGVGSALLRDQLRGIRECAPDASIVLATQRTENVRFYGRLGFEVSSEETIGTGPDAFRNWIMCCVDR